MATERSYCSCDPGDCPRWECEDCGPVPCAAVRDDCSHAGGCDGECHITGPFLVGYN
jgi:hypothetical protein